MPRLNPNFTSAVFFLMGRKKTPVGSGVFVGLYEFGSAQHVYAVTARHATVDAYSIRLNTADGASRSIDIDPCEWSALYGVEDLAALDVSERLKDTDRTAYIPPGMFVFRETITAVHLNVGEDGFMLGLFSGQPGKTKNMVAARFGNVSLLADDAEPIKQKSGITSPCHVFDMHSRPGFSGSPVFVYRTPDGDLRDVERRTHNLRAHVPYSRNRGRGDDEVEIIDMTDASNRFLRLLGIHVGQFHEAVEARKIRKAKTKSEADFDTTVRDGDELRFPSSMTVIVPAWQIVKLLNEDKKLKQQRESRNQAVRAAVAGESATVVPETEAQAESASDADTNPLHREDFMKLRDAAARTKPRDDET